MTVDISEIRPGDYPEVQKLFAACQTGQMAQGDTQDPTEIFHHCRSILSLVARQDSVIVAAIVCYYHEQEGYLHQLSVAQSHLHGDLAKALVDKALGKLNAQGTHKCRIRLAQDTGQDPFWDAVKWTDRPEWGKEPVPSSAIVNRLGADEVRAVREVHVGTDQQPESRSDAL